MHDANRGEPAGNDPLHSRPAYSPPLTSPPKRAIPVLGDAGPECLQGVDVRGHAVVAEVSTHDRRQSASLFRDGPVTASPHFGRDLVQLGRHPLPDGIQYIGPPAKTNLSGPDCGQGDRPVKYARLLTSVVLLALPACGSDAGPGGTTATGGAGGPSGSGGTTATCPFPTSFKWVDSGGPLATPQNGWVSLKDFSSVVWNGLHVVYMSMHDSASYGAAMMTFSDWSAAATATQTKLSTSAVAPTLFYFTPKRTWVLAYQWCATKFCYATSSDPTKATSWSFGHTLLSEDVTADSSTGPIDQTVICDSTSCYLFYAGDNGVIYRASMPIGSFPGTFSGSQAIISETTDTVFEAVQVYAVKGTGQYLIIVETITSPRFFRAYSASSLDGDFTAIPGASSQSTPFAGKNNVTFTGTPWTDDISHGDLVRDNPDETQTVDACNMQLLYQGRDPSQNPTYDLLPYRPGLLTLTN